MSSPLDVRLILVTAEPGDPADGDSYSGSPVEMLSSSVKSFYKYMEADSLRRNGRGSPFHRNLKDILDLCWPGLSLREQLHVTWYTNAVLCSALVSGGKVPKIIEDTCVTTYLAKQLDLLPQAFILALGGKAERRLKRNGIRVNYCAQHPSARLNTKPRES